MMDRMKSGIGQQNFKTISCRRITLLDKCDIFSELPKQWTFLLSHKSGEPPLVIASQFACGEKVGGEKLGGEPPLIHKNLPCVNERKRDVKTLFHSETHEVLNADKTPADTGKPFPAEADSRTSHEPPMPFHQTGTLCKAKSMLL